MQIQFSLVDSANPAASPEEISKKFKSVIQAEDEEDIESLSRESTLNEDDEDDDIESGDDSELESVGGEPGKETKTKKKKKKLARLRRRATIVRGYEFSGKDSDISGMIFMEIVKATDLPPERNSMLSVLGDWEGKEETDKTVVTRTSFDMDPFVVTALGRKILRTKVIRHNLNPVYNEKMVFQVLKHEMGYSLTFSIVDRDKLSGNDFVASTNFPVQKLVQSAPEADPTTGLYRLPEIHEYSPLSAQGNSKSRLRLPLSRTSSAQSINKALRPGVKSNDSLLSANGDHETGDLQAAPTSAPSGHGFQRSDSGDVSLSNDPDMTPYVIPMEMKHKEKWEDKHSPELHIRARFMPYPALRQQFWRAMLKQYDADDSRRISKIELTTMLDTLGSTLLEETIDGFFRRFAQENKESEEADLTFDQAVICLEEQLDKASQKKSLGSRVKHMTGFAKPSSVSNGEKPTSGTVQTETSTVAPTNEDPSRTAIPTLTQKDTGTAGEEGQYLTNDLADDADNEEHVIEIRECPICHQPKLNKRTDADIITHIATCASSDWRQVNNLVMGGFVTQSQAQRKWYSKIINKVSYGGYKLGANSANILVQDRITGQINEERMSVYVRLGIRLLYKALGSREMEKKRIKKMLKSLSIKQGKKYDDPASVLQIEGFVQFHRLDMSEVLLPTSDFRNFNEFFYRALKPDARPCSAPDRPEIIVSPADCRSVVFNTMDEATKIWVKGRDFTIERLFGDAYPEDAKRYHGGSMGIFRLAPQDYHRFHIPVDGVLGTPKPIEGEYYTVNPMAIRSALDVYGENIRVVVPIDSVAHGRVMFVCIGAMMVGSTIITRKPGEKVKRAEELGYFKFGGSTVLLFFEPGKMVWDEDLVDNSSSALETLVSCRAPEFATLVISCG